MKAKVQKTFIVGDEWLYYKIYIGFKTADFLLLSLIKPLVEDLKRENLIDTWFFIRYSDPDPHIRLRFHLRDIDSLGTVIIKVKEKLANYISKHQIWNIQLATYQRELERYGTNTITFAESFFNYDSEKVLAIIESSENEEDRFLQVFNYLERLILVFNFTTDENLSFLNKRQEQFKEEFRVDKKVRKELSTKYRKLKEVLFKKIQQEKNVKELQLLLEPVFIIQKEEKLEVSLESLLASYIHMIINRSFISKQRLYEMMLYDFLYRKYKSKNARGNEF